MDSSGASVLESSQCVSVFGNMHVLSTTWKFFTNQLSSPRSSSYRDRLRSSGCKFSYYPHPLPWPSSSTVETLQCGNLLVFCNARIAKNAGWNARVLPSPHTRQGQVLLIELAGITTLRQSLWRLPWSKAINVPFDGGLFFLWPWQPIAGGCRNGNPVGSIVA